MLYNILSYIFGYFSVTIIILTIIYQQNGIIPFVNMEETSEQSDALTPSPHGKGIINLF